MVNAVILIILEEQTNKKKPTHKPQTRVIINNSRWDKGKTSLEMGLKVEMSEENKRI